MNIEQPTKLQQELNAANERIVELSDEITVNKRVISSLSHRTMKAEDQLSRHLALNKDLS